MDRRRHRALCDGLALAVGAIAIEVGSCLGRLWSGAGAGADLPERASEPLARGVTRLGRSTV